MTSRRFLIAALLLAAASGAAAQSTLSDIKEQLGAQTAELQEVDALLADPDKNRRIAAMQLLLKSGNPVFAKRAADVGVFSSDPELQAAALAAIFDAGGPFTIRLDLSAADEKTTRIRQWLQGQDGSWDEQGKIGSFTFRTRSFEPELKCWYFDGSNNCAFFLAGTEVSLQDWHNAGGVLRLNGDGALAGTLLVRGAEVAVPAEIPLTE